MKIQILINGYNEGYEVEAQLFKQSATKTPLYIHKSVFHVDGEKWEQRGWGITEAYTGLSVCRGKTKKECTEAFSEVAICKEKVDVLDNIRHTHRPLEASLKTRKTRQALKDEWEKITGTALPTDYFGVNTFRLEELLNVRHGRSLKETIIEKWGKRASTIITHLLSKSPKYSEFAVRRVGGGRYISAL